MIEVARLEQVYAAETAADKWWDGLSKKEQQAYIKAHPHSKYAKGTSRARKSPTGSSHGSRADVYPIHYVLRDAGLQHSYTEVRPSGKKFDHHYEFTNYKGSAAKTKKALKSAGWVNSGKTYSHPDHPGHELRHMGQGDIEHVVRGAAERRAPVGRRREEEDYQQH